MKLIMKRIYPFLILVIIVLLIGTPFIVMGFRQEQQARIALNNKQYQQASQLFQLSAQKLFWRTDLYEQAGIAAYLNHDFQLAIQDFQQARISSPEGWDFFGLAYYQNNQIQDAVDTWLQASKTFREYPLYYRRLSLYYHAQKEYVKEKEMLMRYLDLKNDDASVHYDLGILLLLEESDLARQHFQRASVLNPQFDSASQTLITALAVSQVQADESSRLVVLGRALGIVSEWELARAAFEKAVSVDQKNAEAWAWLGESNQQIGLDGSAELDHALSLNRQSAVVHSLRGLYWKRLGNFPNALNEYLQAVEFDPKNPAWVSAVGESYQLVGDMPRALEYYQLAAELAPNESAYWRLLAAFCAANNIYIEEIGLPAAQKAVELAPEDALAYDSLGWVYYASGRLTLAQEALNKAIEIDARLYAARFHLIYTFLAQSNRAAAYNELTLVRDADKDGEAGKLAQELLQQYFP